MRQMAKKVLKKVNKCWHIDDDCDIIIKSAGMAQAVAHLIGSEEVPGPSPGAS